MKGFAFGQYYPADSVLHRMDPRTKVICAVAYIVAAFLCKNTFAFLLLVLSAFSLILISRIPLKIVLRSVRALIFIMAFTALTGSISHFAIAGIAHWGYLIACVVSTMIFAEVAARIANRSTHKVLNRSTGILLTVLGLAIIIVTYLPKM